jgi:tripartite-type tricarboxylate transporter receptor subunit TctC
MVSPALQRGNAVKFPRRQFLYLVAGAAIVPALSRVAGAQTYPARPIVIVVPYPAGGATDLIARIIAESMRGPLGQPVIIENVAGGSGNIGVGRVARAAPDGYTLSIGNSGSHVLNGALYSLPFDLFNDFKPIAQLTTNPQIIVTKKTITAGNLKELIEWLKDNQNKISVGIAGPVAALSAIQFQNMTSTRFQLVPYRGAAPAIQDLIGGQIELMFDQLSNALPQIRSGTIKAYALAANRRSPAVPEIPTVDEAGLPGFYGALWHGLWAPMGTPQDVIAKINAAVVQALADPAVRQRIVAAGQEVVPVDQQSPAALATYQKTEAEKWWPIVKAANLKGE